MYSLFTHVERVAQLKLETSIKQTEIEQIVYLVGHSGFFIILLNFSNIVALGVTLVWLLGLPKIGIMTLQ